MIFVFGLKYIGKRFLLSDILLLVVDLASIEI